MRKTGIAKYDEKRIVLVPMMGMSEGEALAFQELAEKHGWSDLKIVQTKDVHRTLALVLEPKTWKHIMTLERLKGKELPLGYLERFELEAKQVLGGYKEEEIHKEKLTLEEEDTTKMVLENIAKKEEQGAYELVDKIDEEKDVTWEEGEEL